MMARLKVRLALLLGAAAARRTLVHMHYFERKHAGGTPCVAIRKRTNLAYLARFLPRSLDVILTEDGAGVGAATKVSRSLRC